MKTLPFAALAAAPLFLAGMLVATATPPPHGPDAPLRLAVVGTDIAASQRLLPLAALAQAPAALAKFTSSAIAASESEARSQVSGLTVAGGSLRAVTVSVHCRNGAARSQVTGLRTGLSRQAAVVDVRRKNPDGSTTITGLRLRLPADGSRPAVIVDIAVATCASARDKPTVVLPGLPPAVREALLHKPHQDRGHATARLATITVGSPAANGGC
ncbi:hypothetical protein [Paractinoplanes toevensis]|uniref:Uncharacterized protein n=1 Tax=Paractinoplanes toevensis TaxID=571911 RepID=A0A919TCR9_9ACTN|nr:hypothetical protein [Actinoplanes toevensis]GIM93203.1 hypothetical protein Ato02nite_049960 [Actinoplanes toevensis]